MLYNAKEIRHAYKSKYNLKRENQVILLMITDREKWHYLAVKSLSAFIRGITGNNNGDFYCLNCFRNPEKLSTTKVNKHTPSGYSLFTHCLFDTTKNKLDYYRGKNCMKNFCLDLREHVTKIINYEKKK